MSKGAKVGLYGPATSLLTMKSMQIVRPFLLRGTHSSGRRPLLVNMPCCNGLLRRNKVSALGIRKSDDSKKQASRTTFQDVPSMGPIIRHSLGSFELLSSPDAFIDSYKSDDMSSSYSESVSEDDAFGNMSQSVSQAKASDTGEQNLMKETGSTGSMYYWKEEYDVISSEKRPLVILIPWLNARESTMLKYSSLYLTRGIDVLTMKVTPMQIIRPLQTKKVVGELLNLLQDRQLGFADRPLLIHGFSIGAFVWGQLLVEMDRLKRTHSDLTAQLHKHKVPISDITGSLPDLRKLDKLHKLNTSPPPLNSVELGVGEWATIDLDAQETPADSASKSKQPTPLVEKKSVEKTENYETEKKPLSDTAITSKRASPSELKASSPEVEASSLDVKASPPEVKPEARPPEVKKPTESAPKKDLSEVEKKYAEQMAYTPRKSILDEISESEMMAAFEMSETEKVVKEEIKKVEKTTQEEISKVEKSTLEEIVKMGIIEETISPTDTDAGRRKVANSPLSEADMHAVWQSDKSKKKKAVGKVSMADQIASAQSDASRKKTSIDEITKLFRSVTSTTRAEMSGSEKVSMADQIARAHKTVEEEVKKTQKMAAENTINTKTSNKMTDEDVKSKRSTQENEVEDDMDFVNWTADVKASPKAEVKKADECVATAKASGGSGNIGKSEVTGGETVNKVERIPGYDVSGVIPTDFKTRKEKENERKASATKAESEVKVSAAKIQNEVKASPSRFETEVKVSPSKVELGKPENTGGDLTSKVEKIPSYDVIQTDLKVKTEKVTEVKASEAKMEMGDTGKAQSRGENVTSSASTAADIDIVEAESESAASRVGFQGDGEAGPAKRDSSSWEAISRGYRLRSADIQSRIMGVVMDSPTPFENILEGIPNSISENTVVKSVIRSVFATYMRAFPASVTTHYIEGAQAAENNIAGLPYLMLYSSADRIVSCSKLEEVIAGWRKKGLFVRCRKWDDTPHVGHFRLYPQEYSKEIHEFLDQLQQMEHLKLTKSKL